MQSYEFPDATGLQTRVMVGKIPKNDDAADAVEEKQAL